MILTVALFAAGITVALFLVVLFTPFFFSSVFSFSESGWSGRVHAQWLHRRVARLTYDITGRKTVVEVFGWTRSRAAEGRDAAAAPDQDVRAGPETARETPAERAETPGGGREKGAAGSAAGTARRPTGEGRGGEPAGRGAEGAGKQTAAERPLGTRTLFRKIRQTWRVVRERRAVPKALRWGARLLRNCFTLVRFDHFRLHARAGLEDPSELGMVFGAYVACKDAFLGRMRNVDVRFEPEFFKETLEFEGSVGMKTSIGRLLVPAVVGLATFPYLSAFIVWRRLKKVYKGTAAE